MIRTEFQRSGRTKNGLPLLNSSSSYREETLYNEVARFWNRKNDRKVSRESSGDAKAGTKVTSGVTI